MGRGKGGIGFGSNPKRIKTSEYEWKANENIFTIAYCNTGDCENLISYVPVAEVHPVLAHVVRNMNQKNKEGHYMWDLADVDSFDDFFENITAKEHAKICKYGDEEDSGDEEDEEEEEDDGEEIDDKDDVVQDIQEWTIQLNKHYNKLPRVPVNVIASVGFTESC